MTQASLALKLSNNREIKLKGEIDIRLEKNQNEQLTDIWLNSKGQI
jgi:hypothetical protein